MYPNRSKREQPGQNVESDEGPVVIIKWGLKGFIPIVQLIQYFEYMRGLRIDSQEYLQVRPWVYK
jgi:hypothetical protein